MTNLGLPAPPRHDDAPPRCPAVLPRGGDSAAAAAAPVAASRSAWREGAPRHDDHGDELCVVKGANPDAARHPTRAEPSKTARRLL